MPPHTAQQNLNKLVQQNETSTLQTSAIHLGIQRLQCLKSSADHVLAKKRNTWSCEFTQRKKKTLDRIEYPFLTHYQEMEVDLISASTEASVMVKNWALFS